MNDKPSITITSPSLINAFIVSGTENIVVVDSQTRIYGGYENVPTKKLKREIGWFGAQELRKLFLLMHEIFNRR